LNAAAPSPHTVTVNILNHNIELVATGAQRNSLPIDLGILNFFGQQLSGYIRSDGVLEGLRHFAADTGDAPKDIYNAMLYSVFVCKGYIAILDLHRDWNEHRVAGDSDEIGADVEGH